ncbi:MAG: LL-diaminopimelate aminotransferase [Phototrophicales bacterium]|nr:MAG: LL-diaminopimelate aminotransferase [Phototrophicales bacterium]
MMTTPRTLPVARRIAELPNYPFVAISQRIQELKAQGIHVTRMDMGSPDLPPPPIVIETMLQAVQRSDMHGYSNYRGTPAFRKAVARYYKRRFDVELDPDTEVLPLLGSKEGIVNLMLALVGEGDVVLVPSLSYPAYASGAHLAQAEVVTLPMRPENGFLPVLEDIPQQARQKARLLWLNFPNNPTSAFCSLDYYADAVAFCQAHNILLASDNAYMEVVFDGEGPAPSVLQVPNAKSTAVEFMTLSKSFNMAGWRLGAMVGNAEAVSALLTVKSNMDSGHFLPTYEAGIVALDQTSDEWIRERNARYAARRDRIVEVAPTIGLEISEPPRGALYVWAKVVGMNDEEYALRALNEAHVSVAYGSMYGEDGRGYIRMSLGVADDELEDALERLYKTFGIR